MTHNPSNLTDEQIGTADGWRLLYEDEVSRDAMPAVDALELWHLGITQWIPGANGHWPETTYRTKLSRAELRKARNLPDEPSAALSELAAEGQARSIAQIASACAALIHERTRGPQGLLVAPFIIDALAEATAAQSAELEKRNALLDQSEDTIRRQREAIANADDRIARLQESLKYTETERDKLAVELGQAGIAIASQSAEIATLQQWTRNIDRERDEAKRDSKDYHSLVMLRSKERDALAAELESCRLAGMKRWQQEMGDGYHWTNEKADALAAELERAKEAVQSLIPEWRSCADSICCKGLDNIFTRSAETLQSAFAGERLQPGTPEKPSDPAAVGESRCNCAVGDYHVLGCPVLKDTCEAKLAAVTAERDELRTRALTAEGSENEMAKLLEAISGCLGGVQPEQTYAAVRVMMTYAETVGNDRDRLQRELDAVTKERDEFSVRLGFKQTELNDANASIRQWNVRNKSLCVELDELKQSREQLRREAIEGFKRVAKMVRVDGREDLRLEKIGVITTETLAKLKGDA